ncbi:MAG: hypothetical protein E7515_02855 [Ruminococcaceae bacterium]|jgi:Txe/YoeB family toxin of Txe-Axe toxin-antitoxin module|nr:hypothetical protein [Oscillospiraceae bacterium]
MDNDFNSQFSEKLQVLRKVAVESCQLAAQSIVNEKENQEDDLASIKKLGEELLESIKQIISRIKMPDSFEAISKMNKVQYVYWDYLSQDFIDDILNACDVDNYLFEYEGKGDFASIELIIKKCIENVFINQYKTLFSQSLDAYHDGSFHLSALGLTAIIDATLSEVSQNSTPHAKERYDKILEKLKNKEIVDEEEYAILVLYWTFHSMAKSFYKKAPFSEQEPILLNRHWIAHGRTKREFSQLDCIKLIRFLYSILIIGEFDKK